MNTLSNYDPRADRSSGREVVGVEGFDGVVEALDPSVRLGEQEKPFGLDLRVDVDGRDGFEGRQQTGPTPGIVHGSARAFEDPDDLVRADANQQTITKSARVLQVARVTVMQNVETTVGRNDAAPRLALCLTKPKKIRLA